MNLSSTLLSNLRKPTALFVGISMVLLCACNDNSKNTAATTDAAKPDAEAKAAPAEMADVQEITINNGTEPESIDPHKANGVPESTLTRQMFLGLTTTDNDSGDTIPGLAEKWENKDNKVWTFHLRDAKWSNGDPVTAEDFVYSMRRLVNPKTASPFATYLVDAHVVNADKIVEGKAKPEELGVKAIDSKTLEITLNKSVPYFIDMLTYTAVRPVHQKTVEQFGDKWTDPKNIVVNGAYKPTQWVVNEKIVLERNTNYYDNDKVKIDKATLLAVPLGTVDIQRYKAGEIDVTSFDLPTEQFNALKKELGNDIQSSPVLCTYFYEMNQSKPPFNDVRVRQAMALALDRETISTKVAGRGEIPAYQLTPVVVHNQPNFHPEWESWDKEKRISEAKKLLNEAGYNEQHPLKFELLYNTSENHKKLTLAAISLWKEALGFVDITPTNQEWKTYLDSRRGAKHQMARAAWCGDYSDPAAFLNMMKTGSSGNYGKFANKQYDGLVAQTLEDGVDLEQRIKIYHDAEALLAQEAPFALLYNQVNVRLVKPYIQGYSNKNALDSWQIKDWSIAAH